MDQMLHFILLDRTGTPIPVLPQFHADPTRPLTLPRHLLDKLRGAEEFRESLPQLLRSGESFYGELDYDVYPLFVSWFRNEDNRSGVSCIVDMHRSIESFSYLTIESSEIDIGSARLLSCDPELTVENVVSIMRKYPERPLCFSVVKQVNDELLSAARTNFAAMFLDAVMSWKDPNA